MKKIIVSSILCLSISSGIAQAGKNENSGSGSTSFSKGQLDLHLGFGLGNSVFRYGNYSRVSPPVSLAVDYGVHEAVSVGGFFAYTGARYQYTGTDWCNYGGGNIGLYSYTDTWKWSLYVLGVRGAYHFAKFIPEDKVDLYAGLMLGDVIERDSWTTTNNCPNHVNTNSHSYGGFIWSGFVGSRYRFTEKIGAYAELGYGIAYLNVGVDFKF